GPFTSYTRGDFPNNGQLYYWRVLTNAGNLGAWAFLNGVTTPPDVPVLATPADGGGASGTTVLLTWNQAPRAIDYFLQIAFDPGFTQLALAGWLGGPVTG